MLIYTVNGPKGGILQFVRLAEMESRRGSFKNDVDKTF